MTDSDEFGHPGIGGRHTPPVPMPGFGPDRIMETPRHERIIFEGGRAISIRDGVARVSYADGKVGYDVEVSEQGEAVASIIIDALLKFLDKNRGYGNTGYVLGAKGQYADMNRKMGKLKHTLWDGNEAVGESMQEMLADLIGHAGLTIDYINKENA